MHLFASQCELERCVEVGVLFADFLGLYLHRSTTKHPLSRCQLAIKQEDDNKTGPSLQIKKPSFALSHRAKALEHSDVSSASASKVKRSAGLGQVKLLSTETGVGRLICGCAAVVTPSIAPLSPLE